MLSLGLHAACRREHRRSSHTFSLQTLEWKQHAFSGLFCQTGIQHNVSAKAAQRVNQLAVTDIVNISVTHSVAALDSFFFSFFTLCFYFRLTKSWCKMYRKAFAVSTKGTDVLWSAISKCYYSRAALFPRVISNPAGLTCVVLFFCSFFLPQSCHCFEYRCLCLYSETLKLGVVSREIRRQCNNIDTLRFWETHAPRTVCIWPLFHLQKNHIVSIHIKPFMSDCQSYCCWSSQDNHIPQLCR